jgi:hypothetical protein
LPQSLSASSRSRRLQSKGRSRPAHRGQFRCPGLPTAAPGIKRDLGIDLKFDPQSQSAAAIQSVGVEVADLAVITRPLTPEDRSDFPARRFFEIEVGVQVIVPIVSRETFDAGVKSISKKEFADLYENVIRNWKQLGGEDREIKFFNPEHGRGIWELFVTWLYGDIRKAPLGKRWETVLDQPGCAKLRRIQRRLHLARSTEVGGWQTSRRTRLARRGRAD